MTLHKYIVLTFILLLYSIYCFATTPSEIALDGIVYTKAAENVFGEHKSSQYIQKGETLNKWTSKVTIHAFINRRDPIEFAQDKFGTASKIELIDGDKNNILQMFDTMNSIGVQGDPIIFEQNIWRYEKLGNGKGIISIEFTRRKMIPNQATPEVTEGISQQIQNEIKALPIESYEF